jgi:hypothetical protein
MHRLIKNTQGLALLNSSFQNGLRWNLILIWFPPWCAYPISVGLHADCLVLIALEIFLDIFCYFFLLLLHYNFLDHHMPFPMRLTRLTLLIQGIVYMIDNKAGIRVFTRFGFFKLLISMQDTFPEYVSYPQNRYSQSKT